MNRKFHLLFALAVGLLSLSASIFPGAAQDFRATITGRVSDANKAAVPNAQVNVKNLETNEITTATTNSEGNYKAPFLRPGSYSITIEASGFKKVTRDKIELVISQMATFDFTLEAGAISENVTIEGSAPVIETASADRGVVIDRQKVIELPLNARNPFMLGVLTAGVSFNGASIWQRPFDNGAIAEWTINGSQSRGNEFLLDGAPNNGQGGGNNIAYVPPVDSVQDFKIMTNTYDAQYGKTTGGIINVNLKSGTNNFHGTLYEFMRREWLDALDFRLKANGTSKPKHYLDQYGGLAEGPIRVPWLYNGKDKTFFMFNYEGYREGVPAPLRLSVPEPEMLTGDFSKLVDRFGKPINIYDPLTGNEANGYTRTQFSDPSRATPANPLGLNIIPANRLNPIAQKILSFMPKSNQRDAGSDYSKNNLFVSPNLATDRFWNWTAKVDHQFNEKHRMYLRFAKNDRRENRNENGVIDAVGECCQLPFKRLNDAFVADHLATFSPNFIFNFRVSFNRFEEKGVGDENMGFDQTTLGFSPSLINSLPGSVMFGRYEPGDGYIPLGRTPGNNVTNTVATQPNFTWIRGAHTWRGGADIRWTQYIIRDEGNPFQLTAGRGFTQKVWNQGDSNSGNGIATFLLGYVGGQVENRLFATTLNKYIAPWFQDDWKVNRRLTLNLGLRWDINRPPNERYDRLNRGFDPNVVSPIDSQVNHTIPDPRGGNFILPQLKGGLLFAGVNGVDQLAANTDWNNIQPRIGFAYLLKPKLVMRGGWGLYYINPNNDYIQNAGFSVATGVTNSIDGGRTPIAGAINNPFPNGLSTPKGAAGGLETFLGRGFNFVNPNFVVPVVHQFSLGFQYQLPWDSRVEISYVGNRTKNLQTTRAFNEPDLAMRQKCNFLEGGSVAYCNEALPNPFKGIEAFRGSGSRFDSNTLSRWELSRPYPQFPAFTEVTRNDGSINYDSLQITFEKRAKGGLNVVSTYTFSKQIEEWGFNDVQKNITQRGLYLYDHPHRFTTGLVYQLPFGQGKKFFNPRNGLLSRIASGWETNLIFQWQTGRPWEQGNILYANGDAFLKDIKWKGTDQVWAVKTYAPDPSKVDANGKPLAVGMAPCIAFYQEDAKSADYGKKVLQSFSQNRTGCTVDSADFVRAPAFAPRMTSFRHPFIKLHSPPSADLSIAKQTKLSEKVGLQFRVEMFNFTNTYQYFAQPFSTDLNSANFGSVFPRNADNTQVAYPRQIQLAMKLTF
ncbi:MAG TPA: carboxypeptidase-like regulatory domain-containing protein [Blastocatellia bacterium]|nr:carboxypeptidase-like regulatory domain-containing protein [Blastocatellia bacterium]